VDVAACQTLLIQLAEPERCPAEMIRVTRPGGTVVCFEPDNFPARAGYDSAAPYNRAEWLEFSEGALLYYEGRKLRGRGDQDVGACVPKMMREAGLTEVEARPNEKVWLLAPPYEMPIQPHTKEIIRGEFERRDEWREEYRPDYLAARGDEEKFKRLWAGAAGAERAGRALEQIQRDEYYLTHGGSCFAVKGRKPA